MHSTTANIESPCSELRVWQIGVAFFFVAFVISICFSALKEEELDALRTVPSIDPDKVIFMQGCIADDNKEYQCILMWREHDGK